MSTKRFRQCDGCRRQKRTPIECRHCHEWFCQHLITHKIDTGRPKGNITGLPVGPIVGSCGACHRALMRGELTA